MWNWARDTTAGCPVRDAVAAVLDGLGGGAERGVRLAASSWSVARFSRGGAPCRASRMAVSRVACMPRAARG
jgi:hypothetical protein